MQSINYLKPQARYVDALTLGLDELGESISLTIDKNGPAIFQLGRISPSGRPHWDANELTLAGTSLSFTNVTGIRFRYADPVNIPTVQATLFSKGDPIPQGSVPFEAALTPSGGIILPSPDFVKLQSISVPAAQAQASFDFSNIDQTGDFKHLQFVLWGESDYVGGVLTPVSLQMNGDVSANYYYSRYESENAVFTNSSVSGQNQLFIGMIPSSSVGSTVQGGTIEGIIPNYLEPHRNKQFKTHWVSNYSTNNLGSVGCLWNTINPINRLFFFITAQAFSQYSSCDLYGIR